MVTVSHKKVRISQACNACRQRKSKCGGERPRCKTCKTTDRVCVYHDAVRKRGLQSGYVRNLEVLLGLTLAHFPQSDKKLRSVLHSRSQPGHEDGQEEASELVNRWRNSACARILEDPSTTILEDDPLITESASLPGLDIEEDFARDDFTDGEMVTDEQQIHQHQQSGTSNDEPFASEPSRATYATLLEHNLPSVIPQFVDFYLKQVHCWLPIVKRSDLLKAMQTNTYSNSTCNDKGMRLCLWAITCLVSLHQAHAAAQIDAVDTRTQLRYAFVQSEGNFDLGHIQAILILVLSYMVLEEIEIAWILSAQASRMMSIYLIRENHQNDRTARAVRGCILLDSVLSECLDQTPYWSQRDLEVLRYKPDLDTVDEWQPWELESFGNGPKQSRPLRAMSSLESMTDLLLLTDHDTSSVHRLPSSRSVQKLCDWRAALPEHLLLVTDTTPSPGILCLHLTWNLLVCRHCDSSDAQQLQKMQDAVASTYDLIDRYQSTAGSSMALPFLTLFVQHATQHQYRWQSLGFVGIDSRQREPFDDLSKRLRKFWAEPAGSHASNHLPPAASNGEETSNFDSSMPSHSGMPGNLLVATNFTIETNPQSSVQPLYPTAYTDQNINFEDDNNSAQFLDDMSPLMPISRYVVS